MEYRELGLIATLLMWGAFVFLLTKWRGKKSMSISLHAASAKNAYFFFAAILILAGILYSIFMIMWFIPEKNLPVTFTHLFLFTMFCLFISAIIPDTKGLNHKIHAFFAFSLAFMLFVITLFILFSCVLTLPTQIIGGFTLAYMSFCSVMYVFVRKNQKHFIMRNFLRFQVMYLVSFQIFILAATYLS